MGYIPEISGDRIKDGGVELQDLAPGVAGFGSVPGVIVPFAGTVAPNGVTPCRPRMDPGRRTLPCRWQDEEPCQRVSLCWEEELR